MATAEQPKVRELAVKPRVFQGEGSTTRYGLNSKVGTLLSLGGEEVVFPIGCSDLEIQPRLCGDFYAEIKGKGFYVSGFGALPLDAVKGALAKVPA